MLGSLFFWCLTWLLAGYAVMGRGFAYLGLPPVYVGEITLALGVAFLGLSRWRVTMLSGHTMWLLLVFMGWSAFRTIPFVGEYGIDALRDAAIWGYAMFAIVVAVGVAQAPSRLTVQLARYRRFVPLFLVAGSVIYMIGQRRWLQITAPGTDVILLASKSADYLVHLAGISLFCFLGLGRLTPVRWVLVSIMFLIASAETRGGMLAFMFGVGSVGLLLPLNRRFWRVSSGVLGVVALLLMTNLRIEMGRREISGRQLMRSVTSIVTDDVRVGDLENTKVWRLAWWAQIVDYTVFGPYFLEGKGYGINLADSDGFQIRFDDRPLRSPHNGHLTILARSGVPGFVLWTALQLSWIVGIWQCFLRARRRHDDGWWRLFGFLGGYWVAFMVNATFDVFLEGPMGAIWFWSLFGMGVAAQKVYRDGTRDDRGRGPGEAPETAVTPNGAVTVSGPEPVKVG